MTQSPGGGGFGDPFDREPSWVLRDYRDGIVSKSSATNFYGVAFSVDGRAVDVERTRDIRARQNKH